LGLSQHRRRRPQGGARAAPEAEINKENRALPYLNNAPLQPFSRLEPGHIQTHAWYELKKAKDKINQSLLRSDAWLQQICGLNVVKARRNWN
jgi:hypothetical protein